MTTGLPPGLKLCPGFTSEFAPGKTFRCGGYEGGRRKADPAVISEHGKMCARCIRQSAKFDNDHGAREKAYRESIERYRGLISAYRDDVLDLLDSTATADLDLRAYVAAVDRLTKRSPYPPFARRGALDYQSSSRWDDRHVSPVDRMNVLRLLAGLDVIDSRLQA